LALRRWEEEHVGTTWKSAATAWAVEVAAADVREKLRTQLVSAANVRIEDRLGPVLAVLEDLGFVTGFSSGSESAALTHKGILATEVNEGNPILMSELYLSGLLRDATATEIVAALAAFVVDREAEQGGATYTYPLPTLASFFDQCSRKALAAERREGVESPEEFWMTSPFWPTVVTAWMEGAHAGVLTCEHGIFEGNFMRGLLKVANLLNEWISMATFCGDLDMLDRLKEAPTQLLRGIAQPESLYLRL
jgi:superfamily II RNA helicase